MPEQQRYPPPPPPPSQNINEAVASTASKETTSYVPPEVIAQITQSVLERIQSNGMDGSTPIPPPQSRFSPPPQQPAPVSPSTASGTSQGMPHRVFTPPSPLKHSDYPDHTSEHHPSAPHSPHEQKSSHFSPPRRSPSPQSNRSDSSDKPHTRPRGPSRLSTSKEETPLERIWGQLFDEESHPTARLGQFLRGLAVHIIEDYEPKHSIVITPNKMVKYYEDVKLPHELYPWEIVFDDEHSSISRMYRDLECQHHLVQERFNERPDIPSLTPLGFQRWATLLIQAHPEEEFARLQKTVLEMPISNPDDKKERFPKEITRRLFPEHGERKIRYRIEDAISEHAAVDLQRRSSRDEPQQQQQPEEDISRQRSAPAAAAADNSSYKPGTVDPNYVPQNHRASVSFNLPPESDSELKSHSVNNPPSLERERKPYSNIPESAIDDTNPPMPPPCNPIKIERERNPYTAQPGGGREYGDDPRKESSKLRSESVAGSAPKPSRSDSTARSRPIPLSNSRPMEIPKPEVHHHRAPSNAGRRRRSPSFSRGTTNDFRRSDGDIRGYQPGSYQPSASVPSGPAPVEAVFDENDTRRYFEKNARDRAERARRHAEEEARMYGESPRRYDRPGMEPRRGDYLNDEDFYRANGRGGGNGYDYAQPYGGPVYR
ncbi:hypothetical protein ACLMJK_005365 [Lecanora helva]